jgi:protein-tyrosine phosphatase
MNSEILEFFASRHNVATQDGGFLKRILFVCLGNICRSPSAQGIFSHRADKRRGQIIFEVDSAGTHDYHVGKRPDLRAIQAVQKAGLDISAQRARQFTAKDFEDFDHIFVMDERNRRFLAEICPPKHAHKIQPIIMYLDQCADLEGIPDPFHGTAQDFDDMVELLFDVCEAILDELERCVSLSPVSLSQRGT